MNSNISRESDIKASIKFDPNDMPGMQELMKKYGDSEFLYWGENESGEPVSISIFPDRIVVATLQKNDWMRTNIYHADGTREETYEK